MALTLDVGSLSQVTKAQVQGGEQIEAVQQGTGNARTWRQRTPDVLYQAIVEGWLIRTGTADPTDSDKITGKAALFIRTDTGATFYHNGVTQSSLDPGWLPLDSVAQWIKDNATGTPADGDFLRYKQASDGTPSLQARTASEAFNDLISTTITPYNVLRAGSDGTVGNMIVSTNGNNPGFLKVGTVLIAFGENTVTTDSDDVEATINYGPTFSTIRTVVASVRDDTDGGAFNVRVQSPGNSSFTVRLDKSTSGTRPANVKIEWAAFGAG